jgi:hypothetical protein
MDPLVEWCIRGTRLCMKSEVWAAWVQGIGSVLAIAAAFVIAWADHYRQERRRRREREESRAQTRELCRNVASGLYVILAECVDLCEHVAAVRFDAQQAQLRDIVQLAQQIQLYHLSPEALQRFIGVRQLAAEALGIFSEGQGMHTDVAHWAARLTDLRETARERGELLGRALG